MYHVDLNFSSITRRRWRTLLNPSGHAGDRPEGTGQEMDRASQRMKRSRMIMFPRSRLQSHLGAFVITSWWRFLTVTWLSASCPWLWDRREAAETSGVRVDLSYIIKVHSFVLLLPWHICDCECVEISLSAVCSTKPVWGKKKVQKDVLEIKVEIISLMGYMQFVCVCLCLCAF